MTEYPFSRTELLLGREALEKLARSRVAVFGIGGVGGYTVEALARSGVGFLDLIDSDTVSLSNINRQILATNKTVGRYKTDVARERVLEINPCAVVRTWRTFYLPETADQFDFTEYDYVVDAIDTVSGKIALAENAWRSGTRIISAMGAGNKLDPTAFEVTDIYRTSVCPLAKVMRRELRRRGIPRLKVVYSREVPHPAAREERSGVEEKRISGVSVLSPVLRGGRQNDRNPGDNAGTDFTRPAARDELNRGDQMPEVSDFPQKNEEQTRADMSRRRVPGSVSFVPPVVGLIMAGEVVKDLTLPERENAPGQT